MPSATAFVPPKWCDKKVKTCLQCPLTDYCTVPTFPDETRVTNFVHQEFCGACITPEQKNYELRKKRERDRYQNSPELRKKRSEYGKAWRARKKKEKEDAERMGNAEKFV